MILIGPCGVRIASHVQPMTAPFLAISGRGQQAIHHLGERVLRLVGQESIDLRLGRRQAGQV